MISFVWAIFSVVLESIDALRMDSFLEGLAFVLPNFMARTLILILVQSFLQVYWTLFFMLMVIGGNALIVFKLNCLSCLNSVLPAKLIEMASISPPVYKNKIVSVLVSFPLCLLVSKDITKKERGELEPEEDRRQAEKYLSVFSLTNMAVFLPLSYVLIYLITSGTLKTDPNVILSTSQMSEIYLYIALPLAALAVVASLQLLLSPVLNDKVKTVLHVLIIAASIIYPTVTGMTMIEKSPTSVLIFVQNQQCVTIFEGHTNTNQSFNIDQSYNGRNIFTEISRNFSQSDVDILFEDEKFNELGHEDNVNIEETTDIIITELKNKFKTDRKVCFFCAAESNLCRRTLFSLGSQSDDVCDVDQCPSSKFSWMEWGPWIQCTKKCGGGRRLRTRRCVEGNKCVGDNVEEEDCNTQECQWLAWSEWSDCCSARFTTTTTTRTRYGTCEEDNRCGDSRQTEACPSCGT